MPGLGLSNKITMFKETKVYKQLYKAVSYISGVYVLNGNDNSRLQCNKRQQQFLACIKTYFDGDNIAIDLQANTEKLYYMLFT